MKITKEMWPHIVHFQFDTQYEMASTFVRLQEFYESPFDNIRGQVFSMDQFMDTYATANGGVFSYFEDWAGFNVPGNVVVDFFSRFSHCLREKEIKLFMEVNHLPRDGSFYIIGTYISEDKKKCAIEHEMAHAFYYLQKDYRKDVTRMYKRLPTLLQAKISTKLKEMGYTEAVIPDETQAYLSTGDDETLIRLFGLDTDELEYAKAFRGSYSGRRSGVY